MNHEDLVQYFRQTLQSDPNMSEAVAAVQTLLEYLKLDNSASTMIQLREDINKNIELLTKCDHQALVTPIQSGCQLFLRFITYTASLHSKDFQDCKMALVDRGHLFLQKISSSRRKIATLAHPFIADGSTILVHSRSRVVLDVLQEALRNRKRFTVYVTETSQNGSGKQMQRELEGLGIPSIVILDTAIGYIMEKVDMVWVGAEGVMESGGILNRVGTFTTAICAKEMNKPFYVVAESLKFSRLYPLNQQDIPQEFKYRTTALDGHTDLEREHPMVDYTPPAYITLLFTDLGILTPSAVSDELIKLYL